MSCTLTRSFNYVYLGKHPLSREFGGVACLQGDRFILASKNSPVVYLVQGDTVVSSCSIPKFMWEAQEKFECLGLTLSYDQSELFLMLETDEQYLRILRFKVQGDTILPSHASAFFVPQRSLDHVYHTVTEINWDRDGLVAQLPVAPFGAGGSFLEFFPETPIGKVSSAHPAFMTSYQDKLVLGINHVQWVKVVQKHMLPHISDTMFRTWLSSITTLDYTQNFWWAHSYKEEEIQEDGPCNGTVECPICGCSQSCTCNRNVLLWNENGTPKLHTVFVDRIIAQLAFSHPVLVSSIVLLNYLTGEIEGVTHIGASAFGTAPSQASQQFITGIGVKDATVEVALSPIPLPVPKDYLAWGSLPYHLPANIGNAKPSHTVQTLLQWWGEYHLPYIEQNKEQLLGTPRITPTTQAIFSISSLMNTSPVVNTNYEMQGVSAPYNHLDPLTDVEYGKKDNTVYATTKNHVFQYADLTHELSTEFGQGADIYLGQVLKGVEKIVPVTLTNLHNELTLVNVNITRIASVEQPYYQFIHLSTDQVTWGATINLPALPPNGSTVFYARVFCEATQRIPKAVSVTTTYHKVFV